MREMKGKTTKHASAVNYARAKEKNNKLTCVEMC